MLMLDRTDYMPLTSSLLFSFSSNYVFWPLASWGCCYYYSFLCYYCYHAKAIRSRWCEIYSRVQPSAMGDRMRWASSSRYLLDKLARTGKRI